MEKKYKVLHIAFKHACNDPRIFKKECVSLAKNSKYDVTYLTSDINSPLQNVVEQGVRKIVVEAYPKRVIRQIKYIFKIKEIIKNISDIEIVHLHEATLLLVALWIKKQGIKVIYDSHEDYYKQIKLSHNGSILFKIIARLYKIYEKHVCKRIDAVICPCKMLDGEIFNYKVNRLEYLDNYPVLINVNKMSTKKESFFACYTGLISYERGVINNIKAWNIANIRGILAGKFSNSMLEKQIKSMGEFKNVEYKGYCNSEELDVIYRSSSVGMATLLDYGQYHKSCNLPTKVFEYMMYGIPTIIYRSPFTEAVMKEYEFGIMVDPENVIEIADAICFLKKNPDIAAQMGDNGRKAVYEKFNWENEEKKLYKLYESII